jgi:hypothetical protein
MSKCHFTLTVISLESERNAFSADVCESVVFGFRLNHTSESSVRAKYTIYLPSFLAAIHYYVAFPLTDILFITKDPLLVPQESHNVDVHPECSVIRSLSNEMTVNVK